MASTAFSSWPTPQSELMPDRIPFLTFADIDSILSAGSHVGLFAKGCLTISGSYNCTQVCTDISLLYRQSYKHGLTTGSDTSIGAAYTIADDHVPYNIYNCMMYPYISTLLNTESAPMEARANAHQLAERMQIYASRGASDGTSSNSWFSTIRSVQWNCITAFCGDSRSVCAENFTVGNNNTSWQGVGLSQADDLSFPRWSSISPKDSMDVYTDVAGIGISIAFAIQASLCGSCWLFVWFHRYREALRNPHTKLRNIHVRLLQLFQHTRTPDFVSRRSSSLETRLRQIPDEQRGPSATDTVITAVKTFQSAQCFFLISMNIAFLLGLNYDGPFARSTSLGQFWNNILYTQAIAEGGIVAISLTQYCLRAVGQASIYYLFLVTVTFSLSVSTFALAQKYAINGAAERLELQIANPAIDQWESQCGMISPQTYNGSLRSYPTPYAFGICAIFGGAGVFIGLIFDLCLGNRSSNPARTNKVMLYTYRIFGGLVEILTWTWIIAFFALYWKSVVSVVPNSWSLGQILAVTAWVPGIVEWFHALLKHFFPGIAKRLNKLLERNRFIQSNFDELSGEADDNYKPTAELLFAPRNSGSNVVQKYSSISLRSITRPTTDYQTSTLREDYAIQR